jgi:hypothetical protein
MKFLLLLLLLLISCASNRETIKAIDMSNKNAHSLIRKGMSEMKKDFVYCSEQFGYPSMKKTELKVNIEVQKSGFISKVATENSPKNLPKALIDCIKEKIANYSFPKLILVGDSKTLEIKQPMTISTSTP